MYLMKFADFVGNRKVGNISKKEIDLFHRQLIADLKKSATVFQYMLRIRKLWKFLRLQKYSVLEPELVSVPKYKTDHWQPATADHLKKILKVLYHDDPFIRLRDELIVMFLFATGVRVSELCDLNLDQISLVNKEAVIPTKKNDHPRCIFWDDLTNELLTKYLDIRNERAKDHYVFISETENKKITPRSIQRIVRHYAKLAGIKERIVTHSWRHGYINHGLQKDVQIPYLSRMVGHSNWISTKPYEHLKSADLKRIYKKEYAHRMV